MRGTGPAAGVAGALATGWVFTEVVQLVCLQDLSIGVQGGPVFSSMGLLGPDASTGFLLVGLPLVLGAAAVGVAALLLWRGPDQAGMAMFGAGAVAGVLWLLLAGFLGLGSVADTRLQLPIFAVGLNTVAGAPWGRWVVDAVALAAIALLSGFGPRGPLARRALWIGLLVVFADSVWRVAATAAGGQIPALFRGLGDGWVFGSGFGQGISLALLFVWVVLGGLAAGFVALFANLPNRQGPHRLLIWLALGASGVWLGSQAAALYSVGLLEALGSEPVLFWPVPEYHGLLALLRVFWIAIGAGSLGLATWRLGE